MNRPYHYESGYYNLMFIFSHDSEPKYGYVIILGLCTIAFFSLINVLDV